MLYIFYNDPILLILLVKCIEGKLKEWKGKRRKRKEGKKEEKKEKSSDGKVKIYRQIE